MRATANGNGCKARAPGIKGPVGRVGVAPPANLTGDASNCIDYQLILVRYDPPVVQVARIALEPLEIGGREVRAGQTMTCSLLAAGMTRRCIPIRIASTSTGRTPRISPG
jgi:hypothetical protein